MRSPLVVLASTLVACSPDPADPSGTATEGVTVGSASSDGDETRAPPGDTTESPGTGDDVGPDTGSSGGETATDTEGAEPDPKQVMLETYAPRIWFTNEESYWPSSAEWAFPELERFADGEGQYWVRTIEALDSPSHILPFFAGDLAGAPVYGYWADKGEGVLDLVYFVFFPYNRGKSVVDTIWGNHVGDWEHITVRLLDDGAGGFSPSQVYLSAHSFGGAYDWGSGEVELHDGTHPVVYAATGSHGFWAQPGDHVYMSIGETDPVFDLCITLVCTDLVDETEAGVAWDTWENVYGMDFFAQQGLGGRSWPVWMSDDFTDPGGGDPAVPGMGPVYRWGNPEDCSVLGVPVDITQLIGVCRLEDGPTGPVSKSTWGAELQ